ncbi:MAG TPA: sugar-binding protein [Planctomycetaceae bacterium]|nr:sugar-binding protein [Planctomycetaceae bacterium]
MFGVQAIRQSCQFPLRSLYYALLVFCAAQPTFAEAPKDWIGDWARMKGIVPQGYVCYRAESPLKIDGRLDDAAWQAAPWSEDFVDIEGDRRPRPRLRTRAKMLWDAQYFYIAAELEEPHVWGTLTKHDSIIFNDNDFELFIDPDGDNHEYYEFEMNALNTSWDLFLTRPYKDDGRADNGWDIAGLKTAVHVAGTLNNPSDRDTGWTVEIAIPWDALREFAHRPAPPHDGDQWRVDFSRVEWHHQIVGGRYQRVPNTHEDNWVWSPTGIVDMHRPERWGYVQFSTAMPGTAHFKPDPTRPARDALMEIYYHQQAYLQKHGHYGQSIDQLRLSVDVQVLRPSMKASGDRFRASVDIREGEAPAELNFSARKDAARQPTVADRAAGQATIRASFKNSTLTIRQDARLRRIHPNDALLDTLESILSKQAAAWNRGDIDAFMQHYWKSEDLTFSSGGHTTRGWQTTKDGYKLRYPTRERMGQLTFDRLEAFPLGETAALLLGHWHLDRTGPVGGNFSLVFRKIDGEWVIVHDHTSRAQ